MMQADASNASPGGLDIDSVTADADRLENIMGSGERARLERMLAAHPITEDEAAKRHAASLTPEERRGRPSGGR